MLFLAGLVGGTMNALAGGGSGVTFAALVVSGMPPIIANATNTFAATLGYITGALGYRNHLTAVRRDLVWQVPVAFVGGLLGGWAVAANRCGDIFCRRAVVAPIRDIAVHAGRPA